MAGTSTYVKSPVASLTLSCSSVRNRVKVTISVLIEADSEGGISPFDPVIVLFVWASKVVCGL